MPNLDPARFDVLTFDCYGTLIDWEEGLLRTLAPLLRKYGLTLSDEALLERYGQLEAQIQAGPYRKYRRVLAEVLLAFGNEHDFTPSAEERAVFSQAIRHWPPFADSTAALKALQKKFRLAILSNIDDDLSEFSRKQLGVNFDYVFTAEQIGTYKPARRNFEYALRQLCVPKERLLHVAQSLFHDIAPAHELGIANVWVNRRQGRPGGATLSADIRPDFEVPDLQSLVHGFGLKVLPHC